MIKVFADGADLDQMIAIAPTVDGFTTNPTLLNAAGVTDYEAFARRCVQQFPDLPISFEVFADDLAQMEVEAHTIQRWGDRVFVKIPITTSTGVSTLPLIHRLSYAGLQLNVTAVMTCEQVCAIGQALTERADSFVSIFAGRIADTGRDPIPIVLASVKQLAMSAWKARVIWASAREVLNIYHAASVGCPIITLTPGLLAKRVLAGKDLSAYSLETVQMFYRDGQASGLSVGTSVKA